MGGKGKLLCLPLPDAGVLGPLHGRAPRTPLVNITHLEIFYEAPPRAFVIPFSVIFCHTG